MLKHGGSSTPHMCVRSDPQVVAPEAPGARGGVPFRPAPTGRALAVELWFSGGAFSAGEAKLAVEAHTPEELQDLLGTLYIFCK